MTTAIIVGVAVLFSIVSGVLTMHVAESKGYRGMSWLVVGILFSFPALIAAAGMAPRIESLRWKHYTEMDDYDIEREEQDRVTAQTPQQ